MMEDHRRFTDLPGLRGREGLESVSASSEQSIYLPEFSNVIFEINSVMMWARGCFVAWNLRSSSFQNERQALTDGEDRMPRLAMRQSPQMPQ